MPDCMFVCRSLTYAQRANRALERAGFRSHVIRIKADVMDDGCGYAVKTPEKSYREALAFLKDRGFDPHKAYIVADNGSHKELRL